MGSLSAGYANEAYERRRFVLVERLRYEMEKIDLVLYRMLPPTVVAQMKQGFQVADEFDDVFILDFRHLDKEQVGGWGHW